VEEKEKMKTKQNPFMRSVEYYINDRDYAALYFLGDPERTRGKDLSTSIDQAVETRVKEFTDIGLGEPVGMREYIEEAVADTFTFANMMMLPYGLSPTEIVHYIEDYGSDLLFNEGVTEIMIVPLVDCLYGEFDAIFQGLYVLQGWTATMMFFQNEDYYWPDWFFQMNIDEWMKNEKSEDVAERIRYVVTMAALTAPRFDLVRVSGEPLDVSYDKIKFMDSCFEKSDHDQKMLHTEPARLPRGQWEPPKWAMPEWENLQSEDPGIYEEVMESLFKSVEDQKEDIKDVIGNVAADTAEDLGIPTDPKEILKNVAEGAMKKLKIDKALNWAKEKSSDLFIGGGEEKKLLEEGKKGKKKAKPWRERKDR
jgi:hypothetical protein